jgi:hypothetical protein
MHGTSTIVQYVREGEIVVAYAVQREWCRGRFLETARWRVPWTQLQRETFYGAPGPLGYGRADLIAGGVIKPAGHSYEQLPFLSLNP